tara:strand:+ start:7432 stop:7701 length:270 start_codon:yes stop_codon:yes gene_type:complete
MVNATVVYPAGSFGSDITERWKIKVDVPADADADSICEEIFRMMNRVDGSEIEHYLEEFQCRSMSMGDIVELTDGRHFICDAVGWRELA